MNRLRYSVLFFFFLLPALMATAQNGSVSHTQEPTDFMRSDGKIFVVVAVIIIILCGLFLYLFNLDKKITSLEKNNRK